jgi:hypothetical protein
MVAGTARNHSRPGPRGPQVHTRGRGRWEACGRREGPCERWEGLREVGGPAGGRSAEAESGHTRLPVKNRPPVREYNRHRERRPPPVRVGAE